MRRVFLSGLFLLSTHLLSAQSAADTPDTETQAAWLTGPLLSPSGTVVELGHINIEPYVYAFGFVGSYDNHWKSHDAAATFLVYLFDLSIQFGIAPRVDFTINPAFSCNQVKNQSCWGVNDPSIALGIQLVYESDYCPAIKVQFQENFPLAKYDNLDPNKLLTDGIGYGLYTTTTQLAASKTFPIEPGRTCSLRFAVTGSVSTSTHLKGLSTFGGNPYTDGRFYPSKIITVNFGAEYNLTKQLAWALDIVYAYGTKASFQGMYPEGLFTFLGADLGQNASQISIAPALEYNWSSSWGAIAGCWLSVAGDNADRFISGIFALNYYK